MSNPYSMIAQAFSAPDPESRFRFGTVTSISPMEVDIGGPKISGGKLFCNADLLETEREADVFLPTYDIQETDARVKLKKPLETGDRVLCYTEDDQVFYILCKVVSV